LQPINETDYLQKSRNQKTGAWVLLGGGVAMAVTGMVIYGNALDKAAEDDPLMTALTLGTNANPTGAIIATVGSLAAIGSIPFFIASGKNKRRALSASANVQMNKMQILQGAAFVTRSYPALSVKITLGP